MARTRLCFECGREKPSSEVVVRLRAKTEHGKCFQCVPAETVERELEAREARKAHTSKWYDSHKVEILQKRAEYRRAHREAIIKSWKEFSTKNKEKRKNYDKRRTDQLHPSYIVRTLKLPSNIVPETLIELQRAHLQLLRELRKV